MKKRRPSRGTVIPKHVIKQLAKNIVYRIRNADIVENLHSGTTPNSKAGDYTDVKVVSPYGEIPWLRASRISDDEMKVILVIMVNKVYTYLLEIFNEDGELIRFWQDRVCRPSRWFEPEIDHQEMLWLDFVLGRTTLDEGMKESTRLKALQKTSTDPEFQKVNAILKARTECMTVHANERYAQRNTEENIKRKGRT